MAAASAKLGISISILKAAKAAACPNFRGGRVYAAGLADWIAANSSQIAPVAESKGLKDQKLFEEVRRLRIANDENSGRLIERSTVTQKHSQILQKFKDAVYGKLVQEFPTYAANQDVPTVRNMARRIADELVAQLREIGVEEWEGW